MVTIIDKEAPSKDEYGDPVAVEDEGTEVEPIYVAPRLSNDVDGRGRDGVVVGLNVAFPAGTAISRSSLIKVDDVLYQIEGEPANWKHPLASDPEGIVVSLIRAEG